MEITVKPEANNEQLNILAVSRYSFKSKLQMYALEMAWAAKRLANEPLIGLFTDPPTDKFYLLFLTGPLCRLTIFENS